MLQRLFSTVHLAYTNDSSISEDDRIDACKKACIIKMSAIATLIVTLTLTIFGLVSGGVGGFLLSLTMGSLTILAKDIWQISDNIIGILNKRSSISELALSQFKENNRYDTVLEMTMGSWIIAPITLLMTSR